MPFILDDDEDRYYDAEELRQLKRGTGLFPPGSSGHGLFPPGRKSAGYGYEVTGEGVLDSLISLGSTIGSTISNNKDLISSVAQAGTATANATSKIADVVKASKNNNATKLLQPDVPERINLEFLKKIRREAKSKSGAGFRHT